MFDKKTKKTFYFLTPHLFDESGHCFNYLSLCQRVIKKKVDAFYAYIPISSQLSSPPSNWKRWFHWKSWKDWVRLFRQPSTGERIFFLEHFTGKEFCFFTLAALFFGKKSDTLWVLYRLDPTAQRKIRALFIHFLTRLLKIKFDHRLVPLTDTVFLTEYYGKWFKGKMRNLPIMAYCFSHSKLEKERKREKLICLSPGAPREEKGISELTKLLQIEDPKSASVEIHLPVGIDCPTIKNEAVIRFHSHIQTTEEYYKALYQSDVVLLPYNPEVYQWRSSGCFVETILAGKIPLVKEGSWLAYELRRFQLHELIVNWDNPLFFTDLLERLKAPSLREKLCKMQQEYAQTQTEAAFEKTVEAILYS